MNRLIRVMLTSFVVLAAGCGGGGGTAPSMPATGGVAPMASVQLKLSVPTKSAQVRKPSYVSPSTVSVGVTIDGGTPSYTSVTPGSPACSAASTAPYNCTITVSASAGAHTLAFSTYDQANGAGNLLSSNSMSVTFVSGQTPSVPLVLNGVPASISFLPVSAHFGLNASGGYYMREGVAQTVSVVALDADKNIIVGPGAPTIAASPAPTSTTLTVTQPNASTQPNTYSITDTAFETNTISFAATPAGGGTPLTLSVSLTATTLVSTFSGVANVTKSFADGSATSAEYNLPAGLGLNGTTLLVADRNNCRLRAVTASGSSAGTASTLAGGDCYGPNPGPTSGPAASLFHPTGVAFDSTDGNTYVTDFGHCQIQQVTATGTVTTIAGDGSCSETNNSTGTVASFDYPVAITYDSSTNLLFVADALGCAIRQITPTAPYAVTSVYTNGGCANYTSLSQPFSRSGLGSYYPYYYGGTGPSSNLLNPGALTSDGQGNLYVADTYNCEIKKVVEATGAVTLFAGTGFCGETDGSALNATFNYPSGIVYGNGTLYVVDSASAVIRAISVATGNVVTIAGTSTNGRVGNLPLAKSRSIARGSHRTHSSLRAMLGSGSLIDGFGPLATFNYPSGIVYDGANDRLFVSDTYNQVIRQILL